MGGQRAVEGLVSEGSNREFNKTSVWGRTTKVNYHDEFSSVHVITINLNALDILLL